MITSWYSWLRPAWSSGAGLFLWQWAQAILGSLPPDHGVQAVQVARGEPIKKDKALNLPALERQPVKGEVARQQPADRVNRKLLKGLRLIA